MNSNEHRATGRVLDILELLSAKTEGLSLTEIATALNAPKSSLLPILHTKCERNFLRLSAQDSNRYKISYQTYMVGSAYSSNKTTITFLRQQMQRIVDEMKEIVDYAKMPFIIKGIMTVAGAKKAVEAGAAAIVVSNHGGRVQGGVPSTAEVLPAIAEAVKGQITILVDGGIRSGVDVFRALALGADGVLIGRPLLPMIYAAGEEGFKVYMDKIIGELKSTMTMCGAATLKDITRDKVWLEK